MRPLFKIFQSRDLVWRAAFAPRIAKELGPAGAYFIAAPSQKTAMELAGILVSDALKNITKNGKTIVVD